MYLRKSRADLDAEAHGEGETLARHKAALLALAKRLNLTVSEIYQEIVSGETIAARPMMQQLLQEVSEGKWTGVIVMEVERLARGDTMDQGFVSQTFKYSGTKIITPLKIYDPSNEFDEEYFEFGLFMSRREYVTTNRRLQRGRAASAREGKFVGSIAPFGYKRKKIENDKGYTLEIVPEQAEIIKMIFDFYVNGTDVNGEHKRLGFQAIARKLNELKIPPIRHDYWQKESIKDIITNPTYAGMIRWGYRKVKKTVTPQGKKTSRPITLDDNCIIAKGLHEAIIPKDIFDRAQEFLAEQPSPPVGYKSEIKNPLCSLVICAKCGRKMVLRRGTDKKPDYIVCHARSCTVVSTPLYLVEDRVLNILKQWANDYEVISKNMDLQFGANIADYTTVSENLQQELNVLERQQRTIYDLVERGLYTDEEFKKRITEIKQRIENAKNGLKKLGLDREIVERRKKAIEEFAPKVEHILEIYSTRTSAAAKNEILKEVLERVVYDKEKSGALKGCSADDFTLIAYPKLPKL
ncbi:MAG: recombinase family protein [Ruminococcaceae bacterium]|nr:recombinase family protein [Oscillospiraceae bacterium]